jgi:hypothetical protein
MLRTAWRRWGKKSMDAIRLARHVSSDSRRRILRAARSICLAAYLCAPHAAIAHGPTIEVSSDAMKPPLLNLFVGTTVHFSRTAERLDESAAGWVVVDESGVIESPALGRPGDGWHYTFENEGTFEIFVRDRPAAKARIVIVPKRRP